MDDAQQQSQKKQSECFVGTVPRTRELVVRTPEGAVAARTIHRLSEGQKCDTEYMGRVNGAWDFLETIVKRWRYPGENRRSPARPTD